MHGDIVAASVGTGNTRLRELRHDRGNGRFQIEQAALVEDHGHAGGGHRFGDRSQIKDTGSGDARRIWLVGKPAKGFERNEFSA